MSEKGPSRWTLGAISLASAALGVVGVMAYDRIGAGGEANRAEIETVVRDYILTHPEILPQAMANLQARETGKLVSANRAALEKPYAGAWAGAKDGDVVLVEFFDYACGYCRASLGDIERLLKEDPKLKVVFRELPILSADSEQAARVSLAAAEQGRFGEFHSAMYQAGRPSPATIAAAQAKSGLDAAKAGDSARSAAVQRELENNVGLARTLGFNGTPAWVVGDQALNGAVGYDALKQAIADARKGKAAEPKG